MIPSPSDPDPILPVKKNWQMPVPILPLQAPSLNAVKRNRRPPLTNTEGHQVLIELTTVLLEGQLFLHLLTRFASRYRYTYVACPSTQKS